MFLKQSRSSFRVDLPRNLPKHTISCPHGMAEALWHNWINSVLGLQQNSRPQQRLGTAARVKSIQRCLQLVSVFPLWVLPSSLFYGRVPNGSLWQHTANTGSVLGTVTVPKLSLGSPVTCAVSTVILRDQGWSNLHDLHTSIGFNWPAMKGIFVKSHFLALCGSKGAQMSSYSDSVYRGKLDVNRMMNHEPLA